MSTFLTLIRMHGTKVLGFLQVTVGVLSTATHLFSESTLQMIIVFSGLLTAWRGYFNTAHFISGKDPTNEAGA
jgi:hypothetical protein